MRLKKLSYALGDYDRCNELRHLDKITILADSPSGRTYDGATEVRKT